MASINVAPARNRISQIFGLGRASSSANWNGQLLFPRFESDAHIDVPTPVKALPTPPLSPRSPSVLMSPSLPPRSPIVEVQEEQAQPIQRATKRIEEIALELPHHLKIARQIRDTFEAAQVEAAELQACLMAWSATLATVKLATIDDEALSFPAFGRLAAIICWIQDRPDALSMRDRFGRRSQIHFAKTYLDTQSKLEKDEEARRTVVGDIDSFVSAELGKVRAGALTVRIDALAKRLDEATASMSQLSDAIMHIDAEIEEIKPYGASDGYNGAKRLTAVSMLRRRLGKGDAAIEAKAEGAREDAYIVYRAMRRTLQMQALAELREHGLDEKTSFADEPKTDIPAKASARPAPTIMAAADAYLQAFLAQGSTLNPAA